MRRSRAWAEARQHARHRQYWDQLPGRIIETVLWFLLGLGIGWASRDLASPVGSRPPHPTRHQPVRVVHDRSTQEARR